MSPVSSDDELGVVTLQRCDGKWRTAAPEGRRNDFGTFARSGERSSRRRTASRTDRLPQRDDLCDHGSPCCHPRAVLRRVAGWWRRATVDAHGTSIRRASKGVWPLVRLLLLGWDSRFTRPHEARREGEGGGTPGGDSDARRGVGSGSPPGKHLSRLSQPPKQGRVGRRGSIALELLATRSPRLRRSGTKSGSPGDRLGVPQVTGREVRRFEFGELHLPRQVDHRAAGQALARRSRTTRGVAARPLAVVAAVVAARAGLDVPAVVIGFPCRLRCA